MIVHWWLVQSHHQNGAILRSSNERVKQWKLLSNQCSLAPPCSVSRCHLSSPNWNSKWLWADPSACVKEEAHIDIPQSYKPINTDCTFRLYIEHLGFFLGGGGDPFSVSSKLISMFCSVVQFGAVGLCIDASLCAFEKPINVMEWLVCFIPLCLSIGVLSGDWLNLFWSEVSCLVTIVLRIYFTSYYINPQKMVSL